MVLGKKNKRVDTSMEQGDLTDNPFSALGGMVAGEDLPDANTIAEPSKAEILYKVNRSYSIARTRKGGWPVRKENRGAGKVVTLIQQVSGDTKTLLKELQKTLGVGGKVDGDTVQLQGDHIDAVHKFMNDAFQN